MNRPIDRAAFISCAADTAFKYEHPWEKAFYNSKKYALTPEKGLAVFIKKFNVTSGGAKLYITSLGVFEAYINGVRLGDGELKPGFTQYDKRLLYHEFDLTPYLREGENILRADVARGWYSGRISFGAFGYRRRALRAAIITDSGDEYLSDESWLSAVAGPYLAADIWDGVYYDARIPYGMPEGLEKSEINRDFTGTLTPAAKPYIMPKTALATRPVSAAVYRGVKDNGIDFGTVNTVSSSSGDGCERCIIRGGDTLLLDFGQNMTALPTFTVRAAAGTKLTVYCAEMLNDSGRKDRGNDGAAGSAYLANYRSALSRVVYIASGDGDELFSPHFSFFGYRYLEFTADGDAEMLSAVSVPLGSDIREVSSFECSDAEINRLWSNIKWGMRSNYLSIPTDCPQRDERLGWTGDTQIFCGAAAYIGDVKDFLAKWLRDARDSQYENGDIGDVIPSIGCGRSNTAWGDAVVIVPYKMYTVYGDKSLLSDNFDMMKKYMRRLAEYGDDRPNAYGDWLCYEPTDKKYISLAYYKRLADIMTYVCAALGRDGSEYSALSDKLKKRFAEEYMSAGRLTQTSQCACLLALAFVLLPDGAEDGVRRMLGENIAANGYRLSTGFVGTGILCMTLSENGLDDCAYSLLLQTEDPSWLYSVRQGATTIWERWNSYTLEKGFGDVGMNSFNHYAYGAVCEWMFAYMAGIRPDAKTPGYGHFILSPRPDTRDIIPAGQKRITSVTASYDSPAGMIKSGWTDDGGAFRYSCTVPEGASATLYFPSAGNPLVNGQPVPFKREGNCAVIQLAAGDYIIF